MEKIFQYYKITNIKPEYHILNSSFIKPSKKRIYFNGKELELQYLKEFGSYITREEIMTKRGRNEFGKILVLEFE